MMAVEARPASAVLESRRSPAPDRRALSTDAEPRTLAARKAYPEESPKRELEQEEEPVDTMDNDNDAPLDLTVHTRKEITVRDFARHSFADPADYVRAQVILRQSREFLAASRDSGTESDDSAGRLSPSDDAISGKAYKKSLMKRYSKCNFNPDLHLTSFCTKVYVRKTFQQQIWFCILNLFLELGLCYLKPVKCESCKKFVSIW